MQTTREQITILGWLHIAYNGVALLGALFVLFVMLGIGGFAAATGGRDALPVLPFLGGLGVLLFVFMAALSIPGVLAGIGLLRLAPWARMLTIVVSCFELLSFPLGTALGVWGLIVLFSPEGAAFFERRAY